MKVCTESVRELFGCCCDRNQVKFEDFIIVSEMQAFAEVVLTFY